MRIDEQTVERLTRSERWQHGVLLVSFTLLAITGFLVFFPATYVERLGIATEGFFQWRGTLHRGAGLALILTGIYHIGYLAFTQRGRWLLRELLPRKKDFQDFRQMLRHFRDPASPRPPFGWFSYIEKMEYWSLIWGTLVMALTGFLLWFESWVPKILLDIATIVHRYEAILAVLSIFVWHFYHVHWRPGHFPMSRVWLTGQMSVQEFRREHPLAYQAMVRELERGSGD